MPEEKALAIAGKYKMEISRIEKIVPIQNVKYLKI